MASYSGNRKAVVLRALGNMSRARYGRKGPRARINPPKPMKPRMRFPR